MNNLSKIFSTLFIVFLMFFSNKNMAAANFLLDVAVDYDNISIDNCGMGVYPSNLFTYTMTLTNTGSFGSYSIEFDHGYGVGYMPVAASSGVNYTSGLPGWGGTLATGATAVFTITFDVWSLPTYYNSTGTPASDFTSSLPYGGVYATFNPTITVTGNNIPSGVPSVYATTSQDYTSNFYVSWLYSNTSFTAYAAANGDVFVTIPNDPTYCPFGFQGYINGFYSDMWQVDGNNIYYPAAISDYGTFLLGNLTPGTHTITRIAGDACSTTTGSSVALTETLHTQTITVANCPAPTPTIAPTATICANTNQTLTASGATTYAWSPASNLSATNIANPVFNCATPGTYTYTITGSNACGQTATTNVTVTVPTLPINDLSPNHTTLCQGTPATNIGFNPRSNYTYLWTASANAPALSPMNSSLAYFTAPAINVPKTYTYTLKATENSTGCFVIKSRNVISNPNLSSATLALTASPLSATVCEGTTLSINRSITGANYGTLTYAWYRDNGTSAISTSANLSLTGSPTNTAAFGTHNYKVTVKNGCNNASNSVITSANTTATIHAAPAVNISNNNSIVSAASISYCVSDPTRVLNGLLSNNYVAPAPTYAVSSYRWEIKTGNTWSDLFNGNTQNLTSQYVLSNTYYRLNVNYTNGCTKTSLQKYIIMAMCRLSGEGQNMDESPTLYPNPVENQAKLSYHLAQNTEVSIDLYDMSGKKIESIMDTTPQEMGDYEGDIDANNLPQGMYILKVNIGKNVYNVKLLKN